MLAASCSDNYTDWAAPQSNAQEEASSVTLAINNAAAIDFGKLTTDSVQLFVPTVTDVNTTSTSTYKVKLYNADKSQNIEINADQNGKVLSQEFKTAVESLYGKAPAQRTLDMDITGYAATTSNLTVKNTGSAKATVTVVAPFIDEAYYLVGDMFTEGDKNGWTKDQAKAFTHNGSGNVYDAPTFTIVFKTTADNQYWKIISKTNYDGDDFWAENEKGVVGLATDGSDAATGNLTTTKPGAGKIAKAGYHKLTIDMMSYTYTIEDVNYAEFIYLIGANTGWSDSWALAGPAFDGKYKGYFYLDGEFKFKPNGEKDNWTGDWEDNGNNTIDVNGKGNVAAPAAGFYTVSVDLSSMTYAMKKFEAMRAVGDAVPGGWDAGNVMTYNSGKHQWELKGVTLKAGSLKFRSDAGWDNVNLGGSLTKLEDNGNNIAITATGKYDITLHLENANGYPYAELTEAK